MQSMVIILCFLTVCVLATLCFFGYIMSKSVVALRDIAREALLSAKANNASELAQTAAFAHEAQTVRDMNLQIPEAQPAPGTNPDNPSEVMMPDGQIFKVLRPFM